MKRAKAILRTASEAVQISAALVGVLLLVHFLNVALGMRLNHYGILPRQPAGLIGVLCSPFLHGNAAHLLANISSLFVLLIILFLNRKYRAEETLLWIWLLSGLGTWLIGRPAIHLGASSLIYGLILYLLAAGFWMKGWRPVLVAALVFFLYGGVLYGVIPQNEAISWEGHLSGALAGWWTARLHHG